MKSAYTENLADFGYREIKILRDVLTAWIEHGLPEGFSNEAVKPAMNRNSGFVFLTNADSQVAMLDDVSLRLFHSLPYSGEEGFLIDLMTENAPSSLNQEDVDYITAAPEYEGLISAENDSMILWNQYEKERN